jgi:peroxiredoxin
VKDEEYTFDVIYDEGLFYMKAYKAVSKTSSMQDYAKKKPEWLEQHESTTLPVPATFIINQQGIITARHFDEDYKERMEIDQLVSELKKLADR